jgi:hypothetical protein
MTPANIDYHLSQVRLARAHYRESHPQDIKEIEAIAKEVNSVKRCPAKQ